LKLQPGSPELEPSIAEDPDHCGAGQAAAATRKAQKGLIKDERKASANIQAGVSVVFLANMDSPSASMEAKSEA